MKIKIIQKENKVLRQNAKEIPVEKIKSKEIKKVLKRMSKTLNESENGVALAAPQIGESLRIFIVKTFPLTSGSADHVDENKKSPMVFINPVIIKISSKKNIVDEGCLSVEGVYGTIKRAEKLTIEAYNENGEKKTRGASGLLAQIIQHEIDHLNGVLFIDKAESLEKP